jgi:hypothetical protein
MIGASIICWHTRFDVVPAGSQRRRACSTQDTNWTASCSQWLWHQQKCQSPNAHVRVCASPTHTRHGRHAAMNAIKAAATKRSLKQCASKRPHANGRSTPGTEITPSMPGGLAHPRHGSRHALHCLNKQADTASAMAQACPPHPQPQQQKLFFLGGGGACHCTVYTQRQRHTKATADAVSTPRGWLRPGEPAIASASAQPSLPAAQPSQAASDCPWWAAAPLLASMPSVDASESCRVSPWRMCASTGSTATRGTVCSCTVSTHRHY